MLTRSNCTFLLKLWLEASTFDPDTTVGQVQKYVLSTLQQKLLSISTLDSASRFQS